MELTDWATLTHAQRVKALADNTIGQLRQQYRHADLDEPDFALLLEREAALWNAQTLGALDKAGTYPSKDVLLGSLRDLDRSEALLEMIDNSIDAWMSRSKRYPSETAEKLYVYIDFDQKLGQLVYEDNAGGIERGKLSHLVVPGSSDTTPTTATIGSYKTGGKKALFRLASAVSVTTRHWPVMGGPGDEAYAVHLDERWLADATAYEFPFAPLKDPSSVNKGTTRFVIQLRDEPLASPWWSSPESLRRLATQIERTYSLLLTRNPGIQIHFNNRSEAIKPQDSLYEFCGTFRTTEAERAKQPAASATAAADVLDLRPQVVTFTLSLPFEGTNHDLSIEIALGCRTTTGEDSGPGWGLDLYGNDRLFVLCDQDTLDWLSWPIPDGQAGKFFRGYVNIRGPNIFVPWDTHKRHLNTDRDIVRVLRTNSIIEAVVKNWCDLYRALAKLDRGEPRELLKKPLTPVFNLDTSDINVPKSHRATIAIRAETQAGAKLSESVYRPRLPAKYLKIKDDGVKVQFKVTLNEADRIARYLGISGKLTGAAISIPIREHLLTKAGAEPRKKTKKKAPARKKK